MLAVRAGTEPLPPAAPVAAHGDRVTRKLHVGHLHPAAPPGEPGEPPIVVLDPQSLLGVGRVAVVRPQRAALVQVLVGVDDHRLPPARSVRSMSPGLMPPEGRRACAGGGRRRRILGGAPAVQAPDRFSGAGLAGERPDPRWVDEGWM